MPIYTIPAGGASYGLPINKLNILTNIGTGSVSVDGNVIASGATYTFPNNQPSTTIIDLQGPTTAKVRIASIVTQDGSNFPDWRLYNTIPTAGSSTTARVELTDAGGSDFYTIASLTIPAAATHLYKAISDWLASNDSTNQAATLDRAVGGSIKCTAEVRFNVTGAAGDGTVNSPAPTASAAKYWAAGTSYDFGTKKTA